MKKIEVLIIVDAVGALASGNLFNNVYVVDTNKYLGSWNEGQSNLHTLSQDQELINWSVVPISMDNDVEIVEFSGQLLDQKVCAPKQIGTGSDKSWAGRIETQGGYGRFAYAISLSVDGNKMSFNLYVDVQ